MNPLAKKRTRNSHRHPQWLSHLLALLLLLTALPGMAAVRATVDRDAVYLDDIFTLIIEADGQASNSAPDLSPLEKDFDVLGSSTSTQVSIFNGQRNDKTQWHIQLQPRHQGELRIPPLKVDGQRTRAITLKVAAAPQQSSAQTGQHAFIESDVGSHDNAVYVQQQIPYSVRLYYDDSLRDGELIAPEPDNAVVERLGEEKRYDTVRNGRRYHVLEYNYVISAEKSGELSIPPARFHGTMTAPQQRGRRSRSIVDDFFANSPFANDPFFRDRLGGGLFDDPFARAGKPVNIRGQAITMTIKPRPAAAANPWLPAEAVTLSDSWTDNPPRLKAGEPVTRTLTLQAKGLSGSQIPQLPLATPPNTRLYAESSEQENRTDGETIYGLRTQTVTYIPAAQGMLTIPPVTLKWWDTGNDKPAETTLPAWQFNVEPGAPGMASQTPPAPSAAPAATEPKPSADDAGQNEPNLLVTFRDVLETHQREFLLGSGALVGLFVLLIALSRRTKRLPPQPHSSEEKTAASPQARRQWPGQKEAVRHLEQACAANDRQAASRALLELAEARWPDSPPRSLDALAAQLESGQSSPVRELDRSLYAASNTDWHGSALWQALRQGVQEKHVNPASHDDELKPLYPSSA